MRKNSIALLLGALLLGGCGSTETAEEVFLGKEQREIIEVRKEARKVPVEFPVETHNYDLFQNSNAYGFMTVWMTESTEYPSLLTFEAENEVLSHSMQEMADAPSHLEMSPKRPKNPYPNLDFSCNRKTTFAKRDR